MLPQAAARRSSERCSQARSAPSAGVASMRSPSSMRSAVARISSSRVMLRSSVVGSLALPRPEEPRAATSLRAAAVNSLPAPGSMPRAPRAAARPWARPPVADRRGRRSRRPQRIQPRTSRAGLRARRCRSPGCRSASRAGSPSARRAGWREEPVPGRAGEDPGAARRRDQLVRAGCARHDRGDVRGRRLGDPPVGGQDQGVVRPGARRLELGEDVVRPRRRLHPGERVGRVASLDGGHEAQARREQRGGRSVVRATPGRRPSARGPASRPGAGRDPGGAAGHGDPNAPHHRARSPRPLPRSLRPAPHPGSPAAGSPAPASPSRRRSRWSSSSIGLPRRTRSVSKTPSPSWKPRSVTARAAAPAGDQPSIDPRLRVAHGTSSPSMIAPIARRGPRAFARVSSHSAAGSLRQVIPPPTWSVSQAPSATKRPDQDRAAHRPAGIDPQRRCRSTGRAGPARAPR